MRYSSALIATTAALAFAACSTAPSNPIYQQTTTYKGSTPLQQQAAIQTASANNSLSSTGQVAGRSMVHQAGYQTVSYADSPTAEQPAARITYQNAPQYSAPQYSASQYADNTAQAQQYQSGYTRVNPECLAREKDRKIIGAVAGGAIGGFAGNKIAGDKKTLGTVAGAALGGAAGYGIADKSIACDPEFVPVASTTQTTPYIAQPYQEQTYQGQTASTQVYDSHTYQASSTRAHTTPAISETTQSYGAAGTPGYYAVNGMNPAQNSAQQTIAQPVYTAPQPAQISASAAQPISGYGASQISGQNLGLTRHVLQPGDTVYSLSRKSCSTVADFQALNNIDSSYYIRAGDEILLPSGNCTP